MIRKILRGWLAALMLVGGVLCATPAMAETNVFNKGVCESSASPEVKEAAGCTTGGNIGEEASKIINAVAAIIGIVCVIIIIICAILMAVSSGDAGKATKAKNGILYAIVGLVITLLAWAIVGFVLTSVF